MSPPGNGDNSDPKRERSRVAQREYRKRHASKFNTLKDENQRLRNALKRIEKVALKRGGKDQELEAALAEAREALGEESESRASTTSGSIDTDPISAERLSYLSGLLSSDIMIHAQSLGQNTAPPRLSLEQQLWTNTDRLARIFEAPSDAGKYLGDGLYTFAGTLYWACTRNTVSLWETYKLNMIGKPGLPAQDPMDRLFNHSKHLNDRRFLLSLALARLEYKHKGFIDLPRAGTEMVWKSVLPDLRRKMERELVEKGQGPEWWKTPGEVENHLRKYLEPAEIDELQALVEGRGSEEVLAKYKPLVEMMIAEFVCFPDGPRWNLLSMADNRDLAGITAPLDPCIWNPCRSTPHRCPSDHPNLYQTIDPQLQHPSSTIMTDNGLKSRLASVLPKGHDFTVLHISTPPTKTDPLYSPPPNERPERTYCENHFLAVSADTDGKQVLVLGVEVFIYTTARSTTLFVSKADSTGYLTLLNLPKGTPSPIREICTTFVGFLVEKRKRKDIQFIVNLFARAQDQYLFPGSVDNTGKHVLDDRGLIKWWCRVLDPLLGPAPESAEAPWKSSRGYIVVPGLEPNEIRAMTPRRTDAAWEFTHPLERISHYYREFDWVPPRCLIPHFPDDPKSRFRDELDEEAVKSQAMKTQGSWKSVKTLDMFWEMMAFRQECSSGRMTGFIWLVFDDKEPEPTANESFPSTNPPSTPKAQRISQITPTTTPRKLFPGKKQPETKAKKKQKKKLTGPIIPRKPQIKRAKHNYLLDRPANTAYYSWKPEGRGEKIVDEATYKRIVELLLHLDFATLNKAVGSTRRWLSEGGGGGKWGVVVSGTRETPTQTVDDRKNGVSNLTGLVKRKRTDSTVDESQNKVNVLGEGLVKKKPKEEFKAVNVLSTGLIRKKPKE
ncbi:hypothetical protein FGADI_8853 [Fusarium gaditjirri]|uniref:histone acetyltransferase n=1 Tax=Fusarium gaditjirri TaxID=282569 RepID=A0A8H4T1E9_9HYPO|nr:hypothetical protein FGADI_8853 [Fusarium gaditjirri]